MFLGDAGAGGLLLTGSTFDEDGGQGTEDERLNAAAEPVEIQAREGRDADLEQLELAFRIRAAATAPRMRCGITAVCWSLTRLHWRLCGS